MDASALALGLTCLYALSAAVESLRLASLDVPSSVPLGDPVWLNCTLDKEQDDLYSVKWYKNEEEFYRFLPRDSPALQKYDLPGIYIDEQFSKEGHILLSKTDQHTEGTFRCEASAEAPSFQTVGGEKDLSVYAIPTEDPRIWGSLPRYETGDLVNVTCISGRSRPPATIKWYINDKEAPRQSLTTFPILNDTEGLGISSVGLTFLAEPSYFEKSALTLRCTSVVAQVHAFSSEQVLLGDKPHHTPSLLAPPENLPLMTTKAADEAPVISGNHKKYKVGDIVEVNCTSPPDSKPVPELNWFINDLQASRDMIVNHSRRRHSHTEQPPPEPSAPILGLRFRVQPHHFENGELRLRCTATVARIINTRSNKKVVGSYQHTSGLQASESKQRVTHSCSAICCCWNLLMGGAAVVGLLFNCGRSRTVAFL